MSGSAALRVAALIFAPSVYPAMASLLTIAPAAPLHEQHFITRIGWLRAAVLGAVQGGDKAGQWIVGAGSMRAV